MTLEFTSGGAFAHAVRLADHRSRRALRPAIGSPAESDVAEPTSPTVLVFAVDGPVDPEWVRGVLDAHGLNCRPLALLDPGESSRAPAEVSRDLAIAGKAPSRLEVRELVMDLDEMRVRVAGEPIALTHQEFLLLRTFLENPGRLFTRQQLLEQAWDYAGWGGDGGAGRTVDVHVRRLRVKLGEAAPIVTVRGFGYRFEPTRGTAA